MVCFHLLDFWYYFGSAWRCIIRMVGKKEDIATVSAIHRFGMAYHWAFLQSDHVIHWPDCLLLRNHCSNGNSKLVEKLYLPFTFRYPKYKLLIGFFIKLFDSNGIRILDGFLFPIIHHKLSLESFRTNCRTFAS